MKFTALKKFWTETEPPYVFWPMYLVYIVIMCMFIYYSFHFGSRTGWILIILLSCTGIFFPVLYILRQRKKK